VRETWGDRLAADDKKRLLKLDARIAVGEGGGAEAVATLEEIVALDALDGEALMLLGRHYAQANSPEKAIFYFERAEGIEAVEADARLRHAQLLVAQSRFQDAVPLLKRPQEIKPRDDVGRYLEQVERLARAGR
jgi:Flp pilus assembly protein TadD